MLKVNDRVKVLSGKNAGKTGKVITTTTGNGKHMVIMLDKIGIGVVVELDDVEGVSDE